MTVITGPAVTQAIALGPISQILPPMYRFAGDDWDDENAFVFTFYTVVPTFGPPTLDPDTGAVIAPGPILTPGTVRDLTGCTFAGTVEYAPPPNPFRKPLLWNSSPVAMTGTINVANGQGTLTLPLSVTSTFMEQDASLWGAVEAGDLSGRGALLRVQARLVDSLGKTGTVGVIPLFVF